MRARARRLYLLAALVVGLGTLAAGYYAVDFVSP
ncbi:HNH endonuclease, partial [Clavibacter michiganensis subsp. insidiosus]